MATKNIDRKVQPVGVRPVFGVVKATAATADDTAGTFDLTVTDLPSGGSIGVWNAFCTSSTGVIKDLKVTLSGNVFTIADDSTTTTVANGDVIQIMYEITY